MPLDAFDCGEAEQLFAELESFAPNPQVWLEARRREMRELVMVSAQKAAELLK